MANRPTKDYALGSADGEHERLIGRESPHGREGGRVDKHRDEFSLNVSHETSGYYIGVREGDGLKPSRISAEHWRTAADAEEALLVGNWSVRPLEAGVTPADRSAAQERIAYAQNKILEREASGAVRVPIERKKEMKETPAQQLESRQTRHGEGLVAW